MADTEYTKKLWKFKSTQDGRHSVHPEVMKIQKNK